MQNKTKNTAKRSQESSFERSHKQSIPRKPMTFDTGFMMALSTLTLKKKKKASVPTRNRHDVAFYWYRELRDVFRFGVDDWNVTLFADGDVFLEIATRSSFVTDFANKTSYLHQIRTWHFWIWWIQLRCQARGATQYTNIKYRTQHTETDGQEYRLHLESQRIWSGGQALRPLITEQQ